VASEFHRREFANGDVRLSYLDNDGDGPVVVALHGLAGTGDEFLATADAVGRPYRFVLPDLRGHGKSTRRPADVSRSAFVGDVAALIRYVSPDRPVTLVGQSMGGHTAILTAAAFPSLVERLVVLEVTVAGGGILSSSAPTSGHGRYRSGRSRRRRSSSGWTRSPGHGSRTWMRSKTAPSFRHLMLT